MTRTEPAPRAPGPDEDPARAQSRLLAVAGLGRPHGLRGEVRATPLTPDVVDFAGLMRGRRLWLRRGDEAPKAVKVTALRRHGEVYLLTLSGVGDRNAAAALTDCELCIGIGELPPLPEGWHWEFELEGLVVHDRRRGELGRVVGLRDLGGRSSLAVDLSDGGTVQIPYVQALVPEVDIKSGRITVDLPQGFPGLGEEDDPIGDAADGADK